MIVGCYETHLYCDTPGCNAYDPNVGVPYTGRTSGECNKAARRDGWTVRVTAGTAYCPNCTPPKVRNRKRVTS